MAEHMRTELVSTALEAPLGHRISASAELVFHSDRGSSYASNDYQATLELSDITCSTRRRANCWDIPVAESFFGTLETELIHPTIFTTKAKAKTVIAE